MGAAVSLTRRRVSDGVFLSLLAAACLTTTAGCSKSAASSQPSASASISASTPTFPSASTFTVTFPSASTTQSARDAATLAVAAGVAGPCGDKPLPPCPLNAWMKANTGAAMTARDFGALVAALDRLAGFAPPGYTSWGSIARDGASAGRIENLDAVKASCRGCHRQYRDRYKAEMRDRKLPL